ncbi:MAG: DUF2079 domain-containing protein [Leptospiraceae bacterium]|nr:DUF2079 domain-containing protein [Leptospiraceae bacterium]
MKFFTKPIWYYFALPSRFIPIVLLLLGFLLGLLFLLPGIIPSFIHSTASDSFSDSILHGLFLQNSSTNFDPRKFQRILFWYCLIFGIGFLLSSIRYAKSSTSLFEEADSKKSNRSEEYSTTNTKLTNVFLILIGIFILISYLIHYVQISYAFRNSFFLGERDFTSMAEVILNIGRGLGFYTAFHNEQTTSYLAHHFAPLLVIFLPFSYVSSSRLFLAWAQLLYFCLILTVIWNMIRSRELNREETYLIFLLFLSNIYLYRLLTSYHFEILFVLFFLLLIRSIENDKSLAKIFFWTICTSLVKEDAAIYLSIYFLGNIFWMSAKNTLGISAILGRIKSIFATKLSLEKSEAFEFKQSFLQFNVILFFLSVFLFLIGIPSLRKFLQVSPEENWWQIWSNWGNSGLGILKGIISDLPRVLKEISLSSNTVVEIALSTGFLVIFAPRYWFYLLCLFGIHFLSSRIWHNSFYNYYIYPILPVLIVSMLRGLDFLKQSSTRQFIIPLLLLTLALNFYRNSWDTNFPFALPKVDPSRLELAETIATKIPVQSSVAVQFDLGVFLSNEVAIFPLEAVNKEIVSNQSPNIDYIWIDTNRGFSPYVSLSQIEGWERNWLRSGYKVMYEKDGMKLLKKLDSIHSRPQHGTPQP